MENMKDGLIEKSPIADQGGHKRDEKTQQPKKKPAEKVSKGGKSFKIS